MKLKVSSAFTILIPNPNGAEPTPEERLIVKESIRNEFLEQLMGANAELNSFDVEIEPVEI